MNAAVVLSSGASPTFTNNFARPQPKEGCELITVRAAALTQLTKGRASGAHYSAEEGGGSASFVPGVDGVGITADGRRVYFAMPEAPYGAMAEQCLVSSKRCIELSDDISDTKAAALANPGMSSWAALSLRAKIQPGDVVLINGASGIAGSIAVQVAKHLGAGKIIVTGRNLKELEALRTLGADVVMPFNFNKDTEGGSSSEKEFEKAIIAEIGKGNRKDAADDDDKGAGAGTQVSGLDIVIDYLWGRSALAIISAIVKGVEDAHPVRFVQVGTASGEDTIALPGAALRSSAILMMGSGLKSVPFPELFGCIKAVLAAASTTVNFVLPIEEVSLTGISEAWARPSLKPRVVFTPQSEVPKKWDGDEKVPVPTEEESASLYAAALL